MKRRELMLMVAGGAVFAAGCSTTRGGTADPAAKRRSIDAGIDNALAQLYDQISGSREMVAKARGVLVFPRVVSAGLVVGGTYGEGALRKGGRTSGYYSVAAGSVGLLAGAQSKAMYLLFMTQEALQKFEDSKGWTAGVDASVTVATMSADARVDTKTVQQPIVGYVLTNAGLMADLSVDGTKFTKLDL